MRKAISFFIVLFVFVMCLAVNVQGETAKITMSADEYVQGEDIVINYTGTGSKDWIGLYPRGTQPGSSNPSLMWAYSEDGTGSVTFPKDKDGGTVASLTPGEYTAILCRNDGYGVITKVNFTVTEVPIGPLSMALPGKITFTATLTRGMLQNARITIVPSGNGEMKTMYKLYWGSDEGILEDHTAIKTVISDSAEPFDVELNMAILVPEKATKVYCFTCDEDEKLSEEYITCDIDEQYRTKAEEPIYRFSVMSDIHIGTSSLHNNHFRDALNDIKAIAPDTSLVVSVGDNVDAGNEGYWKSFSRLRDNFLKDTDIKWYHAIGNHEVSFGGKDFDTYMNYFLTYTGHPKVYYSFENEGNKFIILGTESGAESLYANLSKEQMDWLRSELASVQDGKNIFIFIHQPLKDTTSGTLSYVNPKVQCWYGVANNDEMRDLLKKYPNVIIFCGHGHWHYDSPMPLLTGYGKDDCTYVNTASVGYLWCDDDVTYPGSQGLFVEVYEEYTIIRAYDFEMDKYIGASSFKITNGDFKEEIPDDGENDDPAVDDSTDTKEPKGCRGCSSSFIPGILPLMIIGCIPFFKKKK